MPRIITFQIVFYFLCLSATFTKAQAPVINSFSPQSTQNSNITITGNNFTGARVVKIAGIPQPFTVQSNTQVYVEMTNRNGTTNEVTVITDSGTAIKGGLMLSSGPMLIANISPTSGIAGTEINIFGIRLNEFTRVSIGGVPAASTSFIYGELKAVVANGATSGDVVVTNYLPDGQTESFTYPGFIYLQPPVITSFTPNSGGYGTAVTIRGSGFTGATEVMLGGEAALSFTIESDSVINAVAGSGAAFSSSVTNGGGSTYSNAFAFINPPAPTITYFTPTTCIGGDSIRIVGTNFIAIKSVRFGEGGAENTSDASHFTVVSDTVIIAVVGTGHSGRVYVSNGFGANATGFTYMAPPAYVMDSLTIIDIYNSTNGKNWVDKANWLTTQPLGSWRGLIVDQLSRRVLTLGVSSKNLQGSLPYSIGNLTAMRDLFTGYNPGLIGPIPSSISNLTSMINLYLSFNNLSGPIPYLGNNTHLLDVNLSNNKLTGPIPASFGSLALQSANFSFNKLSGPVSAAAAAQRLGIAGNKFNFDAAELCAANGSVDYKYQDKIPITKTGNQLSVSAGGTLANNSYLWYKDDELAATVFGDSTFTPVEFGNYYAVVTNKIATKLLLASDSIKAGFNYKKLCPPASPLTITSNIAGFVYQWYENDGINGFTIIPGANGSIYNSIAPSSHTGYEYKCLVDGNKYSKTYTLKFETYWTGSAGTQWETPANWSCNAVPDQYTDAFVGTGNAVVNSLAACRSLTITPPAAITVNTGFNITVTH